ncbi:presenilin family intramembrane aspartyl protease [Nanoarchaeota archaeon]
MVKLINDAEFILVMKHTLKVTIIMVVFFLIAQLIGLGVTYGYIDKEKSAAGEEVVFQELPFGMERPQIGGTALLFLVAGAIIIGTIILLLLIKFKAGLFWKIWYFFAVWLTLAIAFGGILRPYFFVAGSLGLVLATWKVLKPNIYVQNLTEIFIYGGLAAIFVPIKGFSITAAIILLLLISVYDMYAVWKSKHMVKLAKFQINSKVFAGFFVPYHLPKKGGKVKKKKGKGKLVKVKTAILGGGDVGFPLIFAGVVMKEFGFLKSLVIPLTVSIALLFLLTKGKKDRFYPAMPFLTIGCLVGLGIVLLL